MVRATPTITDCSTHNYHCFTTDETKTTNTNSKQCSKLFEQQRLKIHNNTTKTELSEPGVARWRDSLARYN